MQKKWWKDLIARLNQEIAVKDYLNKKVNDLEEELETTKQKSKENLEQAIMTERERFTQMQMGAHLFCQQLEDLCRRYEELEAKSKADIKILVKEVKSLRRSHVELEKELTQSLTDKTEVEAQLLAEFDENAAAQGIHKDPSMDTETRIMEDELMKILAKLLQSSRRTRN
ncbi:unnamed protein product [Arabis nemorensis]|uniref:Uncharacterized protein n=1 Tax=Arabis nemorensis TaxID=586526 RepID=A0A565CE20_9BRAS|nr:unnamed protein product [Arabis nemorensis]